MLHFQAYNCKTDIQLHELRKREASTHFVIIRLNLRHVAVSLHRTNVCKQNTTMINMQRVVE